MAWFAFWESNKSIDTCFEKHTISVNLDRCDGFFASCDLCVGSMNNYVTKANYVTLL